MTDPRSNKELAAAALRYMCGAANQPGDYETARASIHRLLRRADEPDKMKGFRDECERQLQRQIEAWLVVDERASAYRDALERIADAEDRSKGQLLALARQSLSGEQETFVPEGDERCDVPKDACRCMKRKGHDGSHACPHGTWLASGREVPRA